MSKGSGNDVNVEDEGDCVEDVENLIMGREEERPTRKSKEEVRRRTMDNRVDCTRFDFFECDYLNNVHYSFSLDVSNMDLTDIDPVAMYPHLAYITANRNRLTNAGLKNLEHMQNLVFLDLTSNHIKSTTLPQMRYLQTLYMEDNPIEDIEPIDQPNLRVLVMDRTHVQQLKYVGASSTPRLETLSASSCHLGTMMADYSVSLTNLYLCHNKIRTLEGLQELYNLKVLHLRDNTIDSLKGIEGANLRLLEYLNLRENNFSDARELKRLSHLPSLKIIIVIDNPVDKKLGNHLRTFVLIHALGLKRINKQLVDATELEYAKSLLEQGDEELNPEDELKKITK